MSITDELRNYAAAIWDWNSWPNARDRLFQMCDHIDAEHEREMQRMWDEAETFDLAAFEATHIELPKDADGVPWHMGDRDEDGNTVMAIKLATDGFWVLVGCTDKLADKRGTYKLAKETRHYQPDTWEKIIEDALDADVDDFTCMRDALVARCKALAGDTE